MSYVVHALSLKITRQWILKEHRKSSVMSQVAALRFALRFNTLSGKNDLRP